MSAISLDLSKLENVRQVGEDYQARCPACAEAGHDSHDKNHLRIFKDGRFGCAVHPSDKAHRQRVWKLAGAKTGAPGKAPVETSPRESVMLRKARHSLPALIDRFGDIPSLFVNENPHPIGMLYSNTDPRYFLSCLFREDDLIWTGAWNDTGKKWHASYWKKLRDIRLGSDPPPGPFTTPSTFKPGSTSRAGHLVALVRYVILDFDDIDGKKAETEDEILRLFKQSVAVVQWLRKELHWKLAAIVHTGNKGVHAWFHNPGKEAIKPLKEIRAAFGIDHTLSNPVQPCRLPGQTHQKSGRLSRVMWLQKPGDLP